MTAVPYASHPAGSLELFPSNAEWRLHRQGEAAIILNQALADCIDLGLQCRQSYRTLPRSDVLGLRPLVARIAQELDAFADQIGERLLTVGASPEGTVRAVAFRSRLATYDLRRRSPGDLVDAFSHAMAQFIRTTRSGAQDVAELGDRESCAVLESLARIIETRLTLLEATVSGAPWLGR